MIDKQIMELLQQHRGEENAIGSKQLECIFSLDGSDLRKAINRLRNHGVPICSNAGGYFYANKQVEIDHTISSLTSRIRKMQKAKTGLTKSKQTLRSEQKECENHP